MNWFKRASNNIRIPQEIQKDILQISQIIFEDWIEFAASKKQYKFYDSIDFINPYTKENQTIFICVVRKNINFQQSTCAFDPPSKTILIFPEHFVRYKIVSSVKDKSLVTAIASCLIHEFTHILDPKMSKDNKFQGQEKTKQINEHLNNGNKKPYYFFPPEIDAFSKQISYDIIQQLSNNPNLKDDILQWLKGNSFNVVPAFLSNTKYHAVFNNWKSNQQIVNLVKRRIYNDIQNFQKERK